MLDAVPLLVLSNVAQAEVGAYVDYRQARRTRGATASALAAWGNAEKANSTSSSSSTTGSPATRGGEDLR